jgi:hypothetical protein
MSFVYTVEHIAGEFNVWADLLSRWGAPVRVLRTAHLKLDNPEDDAEQLSKNLVWPTPKEIAIAQSSVQAENRTKGVLFQNVHGLLRNNKDQIWIPNSDIAMRIMIIAHGGSGGHRGFDSTKKVITQRFFWPGMEEELHFFYRNVFIVCKRCLV